ncbi:hypothetical protein KCM76_25505, partial [Zooshikella marina]
VAAAWAGGAVFAGMVKAFGATVAGIGGGILAAGVTSQAIMQTGAILTGQQNGYHFSWKEVAKDGLMAAASVGVEKWASSSADAVAKAKAAGESISTMQKVGNAVQGSRGYMAAAKATARQLVSSAMDREHKFSWKSIAASAIGAELGGAVSSSIGSKVGADNWGTFAATLTETFVSSAVETKIFGNKFNFKNVARQAVGQAIGASLTKTFDGWMKDDPRDQQAPQKASAQKNNHVTQSKSNWAVANERGQGKLERDNQKRLQDNDSNFYQLSSSVVQESIVLDERKSLEESLEGQADFAWLAKYGLASNGGGGTPPVQRDEYNENYNFYQLDSSYALSTHQGESVGYRLGDSRLPNRSSDIKEPNLWEMIFGEKIVRSLELMTEVFSNASNSSSGFIGAALGDDVWVNDQKGFQSGWTGSKGDWFGLAKTSGNFLSSIAFSQFPSGEHQMVSEFFTPGEDEVAGSKVFMQYGLPATAVALVLTPAGKKAFGKLSFRSQSYQKVEGLHGWHPAEYSYKYNGELDIPSFSGSGYAFNNVSLSTAYTINTGIIDGGYGRFAFVPDSSTPRITTTVTGGSDEILALPAPGQRTFTLDELRSLEGRQKWEAGETYVQELYGSTGQRHYPVPGTGGRFVDAPADLPNGGVLANEVKTYQQTVSSGGLNEVPLNNKIYQQIEKDLYLRDTVPGYDPRWNFLEAPPSQDLSRILELNRIIHVTYE